MSVMGAFCSLTFGFLSALACQTTLIGCVTSGKLLNHSDPQFPALYKGMDSYFISIVVKINDLIEGYCLE